MNILLINHYAGSNIHGMEYRPFYLAKEWVRSGHKVMVVAASFSHLHSSSPAVKGIVTEEVVEGIHYIWLKAPHYQGNGIGRVLNMITFSVLLMIQKLNLLRNNKPDLIIASSPHPFVIFAAKSMANYSKAKLVFEVRDLWPLTLIELGSISRSNPFVRIMQFSEKYAYRVADHVVSLLPKSDTYMIEQGMAPEKFIYIPNGTALEDWLQSTSPLPDQHSEVLSGIKDKGHFIVGYAGGHGISNSLDYLIEAAKYLESSPATVVLVGKGPEKSSLQEKSVQLGLTNVVFLPPVSRSAVPALLRHMDVLFIGWRKSSLYRFGVSPNKLLDYMMSGKPVVHSIDAGNDIVAESGCGLSVPPENPEAIAQSVIEIINMSEEERSTMGLRGKKYVESHHDYAVLSRKYLTVLNE